MDTTIKPIARYAEEEITNVWPDFIQDSLEHLANNINRTDADGQLIGEFNYLVETVYREGFKDGLALCVWLEQGSPQMPCF
ncbi:hypothetical protein P0G10_18570 [Eubacteriales bacterium DFI.9.88]|nr:hypothetical protein [Eubacteriales bacterium DFI.9.88]